MQFIKDWQLYFHRRNLQKQLREQVIRRKPIDYAHAKSIGLLFATKSLSDREVVMKYAKTLSKQQKTVKLLAFFDDKQKNDNFTFPHFSNKEIDWALRPKDEAVQQFMQQPFDVLITVSTETSTILEYISALSKANLRVGPYTENTSAYDLMIDVSGQHDLNDYIKQVNFFLNKTNSVNEQASI
jgi:hypothetical protein